MIIVELLFLPLKVLFMKGMAVHNDLQMNEPTQLLSLDGTPLQK